jgi:molybdenum cofactor cytidylyltransferase
MTKTPPEKTSIVLLAAGGSSRLGQPKQLLTVKDTNLIRLSAQAALNTKCSAVIVVTGAFHQQVATALHELPLMIEFHPAWATGMASSLQAGLKKALELTPDLDSIIFMVCDQPFVTPALMLNLIATRRVSGKPIVASAYALTLGTPALFSRAVFADLMALEGDAGAKKLISKYGDQVAGLPFPNGEIDIDTQADYANFMLLNNG